MFFLLSELCTHCMKLKLAIMMTKHSYSSYSVTSALSYGMFNPAHLLIDSNMERFISTLYHIGPTILFLINVPKKNYNSNCGVAVHGFGAEKLL